MPESDSMTLSRMFCEKFQSTPSSFWDSSAFMSSTSSSFVRGRLGPKITRQAAPRLDRRPVLLRLQRHEELHVVEAGGVGAVVGPAESARRSSPPRDNAA